MTPTDAIYDLAAAGNPAAREWLELWNRYCHAIDDLVDEPMRPGPEVLVGTFVQAAELYTHPFWRQYGPALLPVVVIVSNAYTESVGWERQPGWPGNLADVLRFAGNEMVRAVAGICGGYARVRDVSRLLWGASIGEHHDSQGKPT